jgi:hypothetical protein
MVECISGVYDKKDILGEREVFDAEIREELVCLGLDIRDMVLELFFFQPSLRFEEFKFVRFKRKRGVQDNCRVRVRHGVRMQVTNARRWTEESK